MASELMLNGEKTRTSRQIKTQVSKLENID